MEDYSIDEARELLKSIDSKDIIVTSHFIGRWLERDFNFNYVVECLINKIPLGNIKTRENRFKLIYPHETMKNHDLYLIIEISDYGEIIVISAFTNKSERRKREHKI